MNRILVDDLHKEWMKRSDYRAAYDDMEEEFAAISARIAAKSSRPAKRATRTSSLPAPPPTAPAE